MTNSCLGDSMSMKPIAQKLLIKENQVFLLLNAPDGYRSKLGSLPRNVSLSTTWVERPDVIQVFVSSESEARNEVSAIKPLLGSRTVFWVTYPKGTSGVRTDVGRDTLRAYAASIGLKAVAMVAIDDVWAALRLRIA